MTIALKSKHFKNMQLKVLRLKLLNYVDNASGKV